MTGPRESVESRVPLIATCPVCWESEPCLCERRRSFERSSYKGYRETQHPASPPPRALSRDTHNLRPLPVSPKNGRCGHSPDQIGKRMCIRCCATHGLRYVYRRPAGGVGAGYRYLCSACLEIYIALRLVDAGAASDGRSTWT